MTKKYKLFELLDMFSIPIRIQYRTFLKEEEGNIDTLVGFGAYVDNELINFDDDHHLNDEFEQFCYFFNDNEKCVDLTVWDNGGV